jgi:hypothetical protein
MPKKIKSPINKSSQVEDFMKKSVISPTFQFNDDNYPISHASHASHVRDTFSVPESIKYTNYDDNSEYDNSDDHDYTSNTDDERIENGSKKMSIDTYANTTRANDLKIYKMKDLLYKKKRLMYDKEKEIKEIGGQNSFLATVVSDYEKYNTAILEEKIKQKKALKILSDHIRDISKNINSDEFKLNGLKGDQTILLEEIQNIRDEIEHVLHSSGSNKKYVSSDEDYGSDYGSEN